LERVAMSATAAAAVEADEPAGALARARLAKRDRAALKRELRAGRLTLGELAARRPEPLRDVTLFALLGEVPGMGQRRMERLNRRAMAARINLARTLGEASGGTLRWLLSELGGAQPDDLDLLPGRPDAVKDDGCDWRAVALRLDRLIREHERSVRDESLPAERWAWADERLHDARAEIMGSVP
jgi:hypothetical protein